MKNEVRFPSGYAEILRLCKPQRGQLTHSTPNPAQKEPFPAHFAWNGPIAPLRFGRPKLLLWRDAAGFHDYEPQTLTVFQPFDDVSPLVRKAVWKQSDDMWPLQGFGEKGKKESLPEPSPTIEVLDRSIDGSRFEALLDEAVGLRVPVIWPWPKDRESVTTDVGLVGFEFYDLAEPQARLRCAWSVDLPPEWEPVSEWFGRIFVWLENHFDNP